MKKYYKDFYGCTASIEEHRDGSATLRMVAGNTRTKKTFNTVRGAKLSMSRQSDGWREQQSPAPLRRGNIKEIRK